MTRFARAKGSKASNEKVASDSTPWNVMKEQLEQSKHQKEDLKQRQKAEAQRQENYQKFLDDQKVAKRKSTWCDFPEHGKKRVNKQEDTNILNLEKNDDKPTQKNKKLKKKDKIIPEAYSETSSKPMVETESPDNLSQVILKKEKKKKVKAPKKVFESQIEEKVPQPVHQSNTNLEKVNKNIQHKQKNNKFPNGKPVRRKPDTDKNFQLIINGKEVELVRFDGFPIIKKDAERLQELKDNMIKKGIPKTEVLRTMKLERRRAEKALARLKKDVCYNCRKGGHNLSDCPDLKTKIPGVDAADGLCFKCGSTEHKSFDCKVHKDQGFRFATCFICKEQGHIARQCPDNPKGLYPNGGGCKLCGDVTHLRKDCPISSNKVEESKSIRLETLDTNDMLEGISGDSQKKPSEQKTKKPKKIKF